MRTRCLTDRVIGADPKMATWREAFAVEERDRRGEK
jgi:hypothetical protein